MLTRSLMCKVALHESALYIDSFCCVAVAHKAQFTLQGCIVNISTVLSTVAMPGIGPYTVTKAALDQLSRTQALKLAPKGVRVNIISPGSVDTDFMAGAAADSGATIEQFR